MLSSDKKSLLIEKNITYSLYFLSKGEPKATHCNQSCHANSLLLYPSQYAGSAILIL